MPEPRNMGPVIPRLSARSGATTPTPTEDRAPLLAKIDALLAELHRATGQMRLSVNSVSYSSTYPGNRRVKSSMKSSNEP